MWMKTEPTKCPHSCPARLTAPLAGSVQLSAQCQGKYHPSLAQARPRQRKQWEPSPSRDRAEPLSPFPKSYPHSQGNSRTRMNAGLMGTASRKE